MYLVENPVMQWELLVNLRRSGRSCCCCLPSAAWGGGLFRMAAGLAARSDESNPEAGTQAGRSVLSRAICAGLDDGPQFCGRHDHGREGTQNLRNAARQPAAAGGDCAGEAGRFAHASGGAHFRLAADRHALLAAGGRFAVTKCWRPILRLIAVRDHVRHDQRRVQQLLSSARSASLVVSYLLILPLAHCWRVHLELAVRLSVNCDCSSRLPSCPALRSPCA